MKLALITDLHLDYQKNNDRFYNFFMKFYKEVFFPYLEENDIKTIVDLGDTFDHRRTLDINRISKIKEDFFDYISGKYDFHMIIGNHDIYYRDTNEVNTPQSLLKNYGDSIKIYSSVQDVHFGDLKITLCPWINKNNKEKTLSHIEDSDAEVLFGHLELNNFELHSGFFMSGSEFDAEMFKNYKMVLSGHYHHRSSNGNIYYLGNPYQMTWSDYNDIRGFHIFDTETLELEFHENPFNIFEKIYYNDKSSNYSLETFNFDLYKNKIIKIIVENKDNESHFDLFLSKLEESKPHEIKVLDYIEHIEYVQKTSEDDVVISMLNYINLNHPQFPKPKVRDTLNGIYQESAY